MFDGDSGHHLGAVHLRRIGRAGYLCRAVPNRFIKLIEATMLTVVSYNGQWLRSPSGKLILATGNWLECCCDFCLCATLGNFTVSWSYTGDPCCDSPPLPWPSACGDNYEAFDLLLQNLSGLWEPSELQPCTWQGGCNDPCAPAGRTYVIEMEYDGTTLTIRAYNQDYPDGGGGYPHNIWQTTITCDELKDAIDLVVPIFDSDPGVCNGTYSDATITAV